MTLCSTFKHKNLITKAGYTRLIEERNALKQEIERNTQMIGIARAFGDLSENAEYSAAKQKQATLQNRFQQHTQWISDAQIVSIKDVDTQQIDFGATVHLQHFENSQNIQRYTIVGECEVDVTAKRISLLTPVAKALLGTKQHDIVELLRAGKTESFIVTYFDYKFLIEQSD